MAMSFLPRLSAACFALYVYYTSESLGIIFLPLVCGRNKLTRLDYVGEIIVFRRGLTPSLELAHLPLSLLTRTRSHSHLNTLQIRKARAQCDSQDPNLPSQF
ncbi:hypothetical protein BDR03DRAFT_622946 [Suillus americanus]|nr:hypothetical protein BDR03DRAFT_622946 [Suillus americanus]